MNILNPTTDVNHIKVIQIEFSAHFWFEGPHDKYITGQNRIL